MCIQTTRPERRLLQNQYLPSSPPPLTAHAALAVVRINAEANAMEDSRSVGQLDSFAGVRDESAEIAGLREADKLLLLMRVATLERGIDA
eukprot:CCRYP_019686-RA/>CCRYP_019686-RA protein AED:0.23 eAED:0.27 QI:3764/0.66/0.75/1/0.66/0.5/4/0/89